VSLKPQRPSAKHNPITGHAGANTYVSTCKTCGLTVHTWERWHWSRDPLGIVHTDCATEENA
jgi:hypothetical protein